MGRIYLDFSFRAGIVVVVRWIGPGLMMLSLSRMLSLFVLQFLLFSISLASPCKLRRCLDFVLFSFSLGVVGSVQFANLVCIFSKPKPIHMAYSYESESQSISKFSEVVSDLFLIRDPSGRWSFSRRF